MKFIHCEEVLQGLERGLTIPTPTR